MMNMLPDELQRWLCRHSWRVLQAERVIGGFAALEIYRVETELPDGTHLCLIYKRMAPDRSSEWSVYDALATALSDYMPRVFARLEDKACFGLLLEDVGVPLKHVLEGASQVQHNSLVLTAVAWLTEMHIRFRDRCPAWLQDGSLTPYPVSSSVDWAEEALERLAWAAEVGICGITFDHVRDLKEKAQRFYPRLEDWMRGPATLTHGDPHLENLLIRGHTFRLADWEFTYVTIPQRDLSIFVQDVLDDDLREAAYDTSCEALRVAGWPVDVAAYRVGWLACFFDNTLMMLGWEVYKYRQGHLSLRDLEVIVAAKLRWLNDTFAELMSDFNEFI